MGFTKASYFNHTNLYKPHDFMRFYRTKVFWMKYLFLQLYSLNWPITLVQDLYNAVYSSLHVKNTLDQKIHVKNVHWNQCL